MQKQIFINPLTLLQKQRKKQDKQSSSTNIQKQQQYIEQLGEDIITLFNLNEQSQKQDKNSKTKNIKKIKLQTVKSNKTYPPNYRTRMCPDGYQCKKRLTCTFAHNEYELRKPYKNRKNPCVRYQKGLCGLGAACPDYHGNMDLKKSYKYKTQLCKQYKEMGQCSKGELCIFIHEIENEEKQDFQDIELEEKFQIDVIDQNNQLEGEVKDQSKVQLERKKQRDVFAQQLKSKQVEVTEVIEQRIVQKHPRNQSAEQVDQGFNIEFNF